MYKVRLGNPAPVLTTHDPDTDELVQTALAPIDVERVCEVDCAAPDILTAIKDIADLWKYHGSEPPSWVTADNETLELLLAEAFGCPRGEATAAKTAKATAKRGAK